MGQLTRHGLAHGKTIGFLYGESSAQANYSRNCHSDRNLLCQLLLRAAFEFGQVGLVVDGFDL